jgi:YesN/AraC family two-component response regulator
LGVPLSEVLNRARVAWVKDRLRHGEDKIAVLALEAGYQNLGYFYRVFRRLEGCAPRAWLAKHGGPAVVPR